jgi:hypothetical protein
MDRLLKSSETIWSRRVLASGDRARILWLDTRTMACSTIPDFALCSACTKGTQIKGQHCNLSNFSSSTPLRVRGARIDTREVLTTVIRVRFYRLWELPMPGHPAQLQISDAQLARPAHGPASPPCSCTTARVPTRGRQCPVTAEPLAWGPSMVCTLLPKKLYRGVWQRVSEAGRHFNRLG